MSSTSIMLIVAIITIIMILKVCKKIISKVIGIAIVIIPLIYAAIQLGMV